MTPTDERRDADAKYELAVKLAKEWVSRELELVRSMVQEPDDDEFRRMLNWDHDDKCVLTTRYESARDPILDTYHGLILLAQAAYQYRLNRIKERELDANDQDTSD